MNNIILIGFMGVGKSTVARELAKKINYEFIDSDNFIEKKENMKIKEMFSKYGENYFRECEKEFVFSLRNKEKKVVATGGGLYINEQNRQELISQNNKIILLTADFEVLIERLRRNRKRPLVNAKTDLEIKELLLEREVYYKMDSIIIDVTDKSVKDIISEIMELI